MEDPKSEEIDEAGMFRMRRVGMHSLRPTSRSSHEQFRIQTRHWPSTISSTCDVDNNWVTQTLVLQVQLRRHALKPRPG